MYPHLHGSVLFHSRLHHHYHHHHHRHQKQQQQQQQQIYILKSQARIQAITALSSQYVKIVPKNLLMPKTQMISCFIVLHLGF